MKYTLRKIGTYERFYGSRKYLKELIEQGIDIDRKVKKEIRDQFGLSYFSLLVDIRFLTVEKLARGPFNVTAKMRKFILERDGYVCQYCGIFEKYAIVEHVIPSMMGGIATPYNLVAACGNCNMIKGRSVWVPNNLDIITQDDPCWKQKILELVTEGKPMNDIVTVTEFLLSLEKLGVKMSRQAFHHSILPLLESDNLVRRTAAGAIIDAAGAQKWMTYIVEVNKRKVEGKLPGGKRYKYNAEDCNNLTKGEWK